MPPAVKKVTRQPNIASFFSSSRAAKKNALPSCKSSSSADAGDDSTPNVQVPSNINGTRSNKDNLQAPKSPPRKVRRIVASDDEQSAPELAPLPSSPSCKASKTSASSDATPVSLSAVSLSPQQVLDTANATDENITRRRRPEKSRSIAFSELCTVFEAIEGTTKRLEIQAHLRKFLQCVLLEAPEDLLPIIYLCVNRICPEYEGLELGIGESLLMKAVGEATGRSISSLKAEMASVGDLGSVAEASRGTQKTMFKPKPLVVQSVFKTLKEIAIVSGGSSQKLKIDKIKTMVVSCQGKEARYLVRLLEGKLRIGLAEKTVLISLAHAVAHTEQTALPSDATLKQAEAVLKSVYSFLPSYDFVVPALLEHPIMDLEKHCSLTPGVPLKPMLAHPTKAISDVLDRFEGQLFTCEYKYDGERAQIHRTNDGRSFIFSRNSENLSNKYPDVLGRLHKVGKPSTRSFVLDCEAVAWDRAKQCILPFQVLTTRKRKDVQEENITVQVCMFAFDLLYLNGESLLREPLKRRRELLQEHFQPVTGEFVFATSKETSVIEDIHAFLEESIVGNCEGLMIKTLEGEESSYEPSKRSRNWLKVKKDYLEGLGDSLDLVVVGGYTGKGKRTGGYGGYLLACYDPDSETYQSICKLGTGFSDSDLAKHAELLKSHIITMPRSYYQMGDAKPDVWFDAFQVWEVKAADLSISPVYQAGVGMVDPSKGISLRFPRFIRVRDDKSPENATTGEQVADMYRRQQIHKADGEGSDN